MSQVLLRALSALIATVVVLISIAAFVWSLIETWSGHPLDTLPLFQVSVSAFVVSAVAVLAHRSFTFLIPFIAAIAWVWISVVPFVPFVQTLLQAVCITGLLVGVDLARGAMERSKALRA